MVLELVVKRLILIICLAGAASAVAPLALAQHLDRREDRWDRIEDRLDAREDYWDRANRTWWRGRPEFIGYVGVRPGYGFAPGYGYYRIAPAYFGRRWVIGGYVPADLRRYVVVTPAFYRLRPAPPGHVWIYIGNDIALVSRVSGLITDIVRAVW